MRTLVFCMAVAALAAACSGGGGGGDDSLLRFSPESITTTVPQGQQARITLTGTANYIPDLHGGLPVAIAVLADTTFDGTSLSMYQSGEMSYTLSMLTAPGLSPGTHHGYIEVRACQDLEPQKICNHPYGGSPWHIEYTITVVAGRDWSVTPASVSTRVPEGQSAQVALSVTAPNAPTTPVQIGVFVDPGVFSDTPSVRPTSPTSYAVSVQTLSTLSAGPHDGNVTVRICQDDASICTHPYPGSPWTVHVHVDVAGAPAPGQLGFDAGEVSRWVLAGNLGANSGDIRYPVAATMVADDAVFQAGTASLKITAPIVPNAWGTDDLTDVRLFLREDRAAVDFTGRTFSTYVHLGPGAEGVRWMEVALLDAFDRPLQGKYQAVTGDTWQHLTFTPCATAGDAGCDAESYRRPGFDLTQISSVTLRISTGDGGAPVSAATWNVDTVSW